MDTFAVYLKPRSSMASLPSSDTLFGAVCWGMRLLGLVDNLSSWLEQQIEAPSFAFSAPFPVIYHNNADPLLHFFPRPAFLEVSPLLIQQWVQKLPQKNQKKGLIELSGKAKQLNKSAYVSQGVLLQLIQQKIDLLKKVEAIINENDYVLGRGFLLTQSERQQIGIESDMDGYFLEEVLVQHNHIDRVTSTTAEGLLFMRKETWFQPQVGLWSLLKASKEDVEDKIKPALKFLEDNGIGANRSVGKGFYTITVRELPLSLFTIKEGNAMMILSRYLPTVEEMQKLVTPYAYQIKTLHPKREDKYPTAVLESGSQPIYKEMIRVFEPGSVFLSKEEKPIWGRLVKVVPEDEAPIYQSGAAIAIQMQLAEVS